MNILKYFSQVIFYDGRRCLSVCFLFWNHDSQELTCSSSLSQHRFDRRRHCSILGCSNRVDTGRCTSNTVRPCTLVTAGKNSTPFTLNLKQRACKITCPCHIISSRRGIKCHRSFQSYCNNYTFRDVWSILSNRLSFFVTAYFLQSFIIPSKIFFIQLLYFLEIKMKIKMKDN